MYKNIVNEQNSVPHCSFGISIQHWLRIFAFRSSRFTAVINKTISFCPLRLFLLFILRFRFRFKIALLLPIKHRIIYITIKSTWNVNTSTNTAMHYHGSKGSWKSCGIYGLLVCYTYSKYISTGVQRVQQKKKVTQNDITSNYVSTTHAVHDFNTVQLK